MQIEVLLGALAICAAQFPSSGGTPVDSSNEDTLPVLQKGYYQPYTTKEELFIIAQLESLPGKHTISDWKNIAKAHKRMWDSKTKGFNYYRTAVGLRTHFTRCMLKDNALVTVPESIKKKVGKSRFHYHPQEEKLINDYLLSYTGSSLHNIQLWREIQREHDLRRESRAIGFKHERTAKSLLSHFRRHMKPRGMITLAASERFPSRLKKRRHSGGSEGPSIAKKQSRCSQDAVKTDGKNWDSVENNEENWDTIQNNEEDWNTVQNDDGNPGAVRNDEENWAAPLFEAMEYLSDFVENAEDEDENDDSTDT